MNLSFVSDGHTFREVKFYNNDLKKQITVTPTDYLDFVVALRDTFKDIIGTDIAKAYPDLAKIYLFIKQTYLVPLIYPECRMELAEIIYTSLEEMYRDLYAQYLDGSGIVSYKYYIRLDELVKTVDNHIAKNYSIKET